jgi:hypothetical protein
MALSFTGGAVRTGITTHATERTWLMWARYPLSNGGVTYSRVFDQITTGAGVGLLLVDTSGIFSFSSYFGGAESSWQYTRPAINTWHHIALSYSNSSAANNPVFYINGAATTAASFVHQSGSFSGNSAELLIGNRSVLDRTFAGHIAEFAQYNRILSADEVLACYKKGRPFQKDFTEHIPMIRDGRRMKSGPAAVYGTVTPQPHPRIYP